MDLNDLRIGVTLLSFLIFAAIVMWALAPRNRRRFDEAQRLPFEGELPASAREKDAP
jgi:cytochrome c oxidase cbb3-type subunit IV